MVTAALPASPAAHWPTAATRTAVRRTGRGPNRLTAASPRTRPSIIPQFAAAGASAATARDEWPAVRASTLLQLSAAPSAIREANAMIPEARTACRSARQPPEPPGAGRGWSASRAEQSPGSGQRGGDQGRSCDGEVPREPRTSAGGERGAQRAGQGPRRVRAVQPGHQRPTAGPLQGCPLRVHAAVQGAEARPVHQQHGRQLEAVPRLGEQRQRHGGRDERGPRDARAARPLHERGDDLGHGEHAHRVAGQGQAQGPGAGTEVMRQRGQPCRPRPKAGPAGGEADADAGPRPQAETPEATGVPGHAGPGDVVDGRREALRQLAAVGCGDRQGGREQDLHRLPVGSCPAGQQDPVPPQARVGDIGQKPGRVAIRAADRHAELQSPPGGRPEVRPDGGEGGQQAAEVAALPGGVLDQVLPLDAADDGQRGRAGDRMVRVRVADGPGGRGRTAGPRRRPR